MRQGDALPITGHEEIVQRLQVQVFDEFGAALLQDVVKHTVVASQNPGSAHCWCMRTA